MVTDLMHLMPYQQHIIIIIKTLFKEHTFRQAQSSLSHLHNIYSYKQKI
jgi:hypothetical protein